MLPFIAAVAAEAGLDDSGYRVTTNHGPDARQSVSTSTGTSWAGPGYPTRCERPGNGARRARHRARRRRGGGAGRRARPRAARAGGPPRPGDRPARQPADPGRPARSACAPAAEVVEQLAGLVRAGRPIAPGTIDAVVHSVEGPEAVGSMMDDVVWRNRQSVVTPRTAGQKRYVDAIREQHDHLRHRPGRHGQDLPGGGDGHGRADAARGGPHHPHPPGGGGRRAARVPARRPGGEGGPLPAPALRRALRHDRRPSAWRRCFERGQIEVAPLAFMRGRTLNDSFIILDEAQNTTPEQMKMFLTRLGYGSRMVVTGDVTQIDLPRGAALGAGRGARRARGRGGHRLRAPRPRTTWCATGWCSASSTPTWPSGPGAPSDRGGGPR